MKIVRQIVWVFVPMAMNCIFKAVEADKGVFHHGAFDNTCDVQFAPDFFGKSTDTCKGIIDIEYGSVTLFDSTLLCTLVVTDLPDTIVFNSDSTGDVRLEYKWKFEFRDKTDTTRFVFMMAGIETGDNRQPVRSPLWERIVGGVAVYTVGDGFIFYNRQISLMTIAGNTMTMLYDGHDDPAVVERVENSSIKINTYYSKRLNPDLEDTLVVVQ